MILLNGFHDSQTYTLLTKTLAIADFPSSAPFLSVALTSNPNTRPASLVNAATTLTLPVTGSMANRGACSLII